MTFSKIRQKMIKIFKLRNPRRIILCMLNGNQELMARTTAKRMTLNRIQLLASKFWYVIAIFAIFLVVSFNPSLLNTGIIGSIPSSQGGPSGELSEMRVATWNIAAVNNNPFEYWITSPDPQYNELMQSISAFILDPKDGDVPISTVFTEQMLSELTELMRSAGFQSLTELQPYWTEHFRDRTIVSGFLKDASIGKKRLASMPDRVTNTITLADGSLALRPTVINCFQKGGLDTMDSWWTHWKNFFFHEEIMVKKKAGSEPSSVKVNQLVGPISRAKYPSVTEAEESMSQPLQMLSLAIFDAILVHMMNKVSKPAAWQQMRQQMCQQLNSRKSDRILDILSSQYGDRDIIFLQEVAGTFKTQVAQKKPAFASQFSIHESALMDPDRDQNSFLLLRPSRFAPEVTEVTAEVLKLLEEAAAQAGKKVPVVAGDLIVMLAQDSDVFVRASGAKEAQGYVLASFHGDTNGLATQPVVEAVHAYTSRMQPRRRLLFGLDANTYNRPEASKDEVYGVDAFLKYLQTRHLTTCFHTPSSTPLQPVNPTNRSMPILTTFHARTHLQPQLNKAISYAQRESRGDKNWKDFVLYFAADFAALQTVKDNTGERRYVEDMVFPTLQFPSDHGLVAATLRVLSADSGNLRSGVKK